VAVIGEVILCVVVLVPAIVLCAFLWRTVRRTPRPPRRADGDHRGYFAFVLRALDGTLFPPRRRR
jgi:hypothetical protein